MLNRKPPTADPPSVPHGATGRLHVAELDPGGDPRWASLVAGHPQGLIYHHPAWLATLGREYGRRPLVLGCEDDGGRLHGVLPLLSTRGLPFRRGGHLVGRRLSSLPRTPAAGPLAVSDEAREALITAAVARVRAQPGIQLQLKLTSPALDGMMDGLVGIRWRLSYELTLTEDPDELRFGDGRTHRRNTWAVNKARRLGVRVRPAETEAELRAWYRLYLETMRGLAVPARSYRFFQAAWDVLRPLGFMRLLLAEQPADGGTRLLAGSVFLMFGQTVHYAFTGWHRADHSLRANDLIHWQAIQDACRQGFRRYDFGEVAGNQQSLAAFKSKWGSSATQLYRYHFPSPGPAESAGSDNGRLHGLAMATWRRLPLRATAIVGDRIYQYL
jgi:hypothetical protein